MDIEKIKKELGEAAVFPIGEVNPFGQFFDGTSYLQMLTTTGVVIGNVTFEPGCRNHWHRHVNGGQILLCTGGRGYYQEWGKPARELHPGDCVQIGDELHWHGAAPDSWFSHIAVEVPGENCKTEWCEAVSEEAYQKLGKEV